MLFLGSFSIEAADRAKVALAMPADNICGKPINQQKTETYRGELKGKTRYMRRFLEQSARESSYNPSRLDEMTDGAIATREQA